MLTKFIRMHPELVLLEKLYLLTHPLSPGDIIVRRDRNPMDAERRAEVKFVSQDSATVQVKSGYYISIDRTEIRKVKSHG